VDGTVTLGVYNSLGVTLQTIVPGLFQTAGLYTVPVDVTTLIKGNYSLTLTLTGGITPVQKTIKIIKK
jgi:hypothetical protein